jgi:sucrose-6F-phosphate phosphohydrolase
MMDQTLKDNWILVSDLDDTLLGDDEALNRFRRFYERNQPQLEVIYASGRFCDSIDEDLEKTELPEPLVTIGGVGSEIWIYPTRQPLRAWSEKISEHWSAEKVRDVLSGESDLKMQGEEDQSSYKVSYYLEGASRERLRELEYKLKKADIRFNSIYSSQRDLDILPVGVNKGKAAAFLIDYLKRPHERVITSGNSGNDATLFENNFAGIIVANADDDLKKHQDKRNVYLADASYADGVIEGIEYWTERGSL